MIFRFKITLLFLFLTSTLFAQPVAEKGVLDLRNWDFSKGNVQLNGEWEFYWHKLYTPSDFAEKTRMPDAYINVPTVWNKNPQFSETGYGTYRLVILMNPDYENTYAFYLKEVLSAYKLWWNGKLIASLGKVGTSPADYEAKVYPVLEEVPADRGRIEVVIQVANYSHRDAGIITPPEFGQFYTLHKSFLYSSLLDIGRFESVVMVIFTPPVSIGGINS
jgi:hypothetical protein